MKEPSKKMKPSSDADGAVPSLEDVTNAMSWEERLAHARTLREQALADEKGQDAPVVSKKPRKRAIREKVDVEPVRADNEDLGGDVPSIEEVMDGATWEDRLARARIRREQVVARRNHGQERKPALTSDKKKSAYKDTIRVAISGAAPSRSDEVPEPELYTAPASQAGYSKFPRWPIAAGVVVLIGLALIVTMRPADDRQTTSDTALMQPAPAGAETANANPAKGGRPGSVPGPVIVNSTPNNPQVASVKLADVEPTTPAKQRPPTAKALVMTSAPVLSNEQSVSVLTGDSDQSSLIASVDPGLPTGSKPAAVPALHQASLPTAGPLPDVSALGGLREGDKNNTAPAGKSLAMSTIGGRFNFQDSGQSESLTARSVATATARTKPSGITFLSPPSKDVPLALPSPARTFRVASISPLFPLTDTPSGTAPVLATSLRTQGETARSVSPPALSAHLPKAKTPVVPDDPPAAIATPDVAAQTFETRDYAIRLSAPTSLTGGRLNTYVKALEETGYDVGTAKRVAFRISQNHVRFFHPEDQETARQLANAIGGKLRDFTDFSPSPDLGTIEIWLAGNGTSARRPRSTNPAPPAQDPALTALRNRLLQSLRRGDHL